MRTSRTITAAVTLATAISLIFTGCGSNGGPEGEPATESSVAEATPSPTGPAVPDGWKPASAEIAQLHVPPTWELKSYRDQAQTMSAPKNDVGLSPGSGEIMAGAYGADGDIKEAVEALAKLLHDQLKGDSSLTALERVPDETINGVLFYHFRAETEYTWQDHYGTVDSTTRDQVTISWEFNKSDIDRKGADALIAPIMATYETL